MNAASNNTVRAVAWGTSGNQGSPLATGVDPQVGGRRLDLHSLVLVTGRPSEAALHRELKDE